MRKSNLSCLALLCVSFLEMVNVACGQTTQSYTVLVSAVAQTNPPTITLSWTPDPNATSYAVSRKTLNAISFTPIRTLSSNVTSYVDTNVSIGGSYEYEISKEARSYSAEGYIYAGIQAPLTESQGKVVLVVDNSQSPGLALELTRLQQDLVGDGWIVLRHDVPRMAVDPASSDSSLYAARSNEIASVKALINSDYLADPTNVTAVFLFGHVPIPYSGNIAPDGHSDHQGAWPADAFYGDITGVWTDSSTSISASGDARNHNVPGDGKFDQSGFPANIKLEVGRVDFSNMPAFPTSETELLRQYLNKDHAFRTKLFTAVSRGLVDDHFGIFNGEAFAANGFENFAAMFGATNVIAGPWPDTLTNQSYLWGYGCGGGTYTSADGVASTSDFVASDPQVVFTMLFGSYFGDWDAQNNLMRAALATPTYTLSCAWAGRPYWFFHHMGLGQTLGFGARVSQNNTTTYSANFEIRGVQMGLMGDPTLRLNPIAPPSALTINADPNGGVDLAWAASTDAVIGYHIYSAPTAAGPFSRLNGNLIAGTNFTDPTSTTNVYMVRAVTLQVTGSGSYFNASQGIFQSLGSTPVNPTIQVLQPTNNSVFAAPATVQLNFSTFDPTNSITNFSILANGLTISQSVSPVQTFSWNNVPAGNYSVSVSVAYPGGVATSQSLNIVVVGTGPNLIINSQPDGSFVIGGHGAPGLTNRVQFSTDLLGTNWQALGTVVADSSGNFQITDQSASPLRVYRTVSP